MCHRVGWLLKNINWQNIKQTKMNLFFLSVFSHYLIYLMVGELNNVPQKLIHVYSGNQKLFFQHKLIKDDSQF